LRIGFHFPWRNTVTRQLAHIFCTVANSFARILYYIGLFLFVLLLVQYRQFVKIPFYLS
jgi:hypothetical protein